MRRDLLARLARVEAAIASAGPVDPAVCVVVGERVTAADRRAASLKHPRKHIVFVMVCDASLQSRIRPITQGLLQ